jgi:hypothetical protein
MLQYIAQKNVVGGAVGEVSSYFFYVAGFVSM